LPSVAARVLHQQAEKTYCKARIVCRNVVAIYCWFAGAGNMATDGAQALLLARRAYEHGMKAAAVILFETEPCSDVALQRLL
jgi:hypothetical protein